MLSSNSKCSRLVIPETATMVSLRDPGCLNYLRNISISPNEYFFLPWGCVILRNCSENGDLRSFSSLRDFKEQRHLGECQWLLLTLHLFVDQVFIIFSLLE